MQVQYVIKREMKIEKKTNPISENKKNQQTIYYNVVANNCVSNKFFLGGNFKIK